MKDPTKAILKAYVDVLKNSIVYDGNTIHVGVAIPQNTTEWVYIYVESMENIKTEGKSLFIILIALQVVSMQDILESDDTIVNDIVEQVIELIDDKSSFKLKGFDLVDLMPSNFDRDEQTTETNHIITRKIQISNYVQQI